MELTLSDRDRRLHTKLYASASDIAFARACAEHLQKKAWFRRPWARGKVYFHQSAYVTSLIVSYARPFSTGRGGMTFPQRLIPYTADEFALHAELLDRRNKVHAHSDLDQWNVRPWRSGDFATTIVSQPWMIIEAPQVETFLAMTARLQASITRRLVEIVEA